MSKPTVVTTRIHTVANDSARIDNLERQFLEFLYLLGNSRELSRAKGHIEEAAMWAKKHVANR